MKARWLKFVLNLTNRIYKRKQAIVHQEGVAVIGYVISLFFFELFLAIISLPLYIGIKPEKVTAFFKEKGTYEKVSYDYSLRRILTLTGVGIVFFIWLLKLIVILYTPKVTGPLQLYQVSNLEPVNITEASLVTADTQIQTAKINNKIIKPKLLGVEKVANGGYTFSGTGQALTSIVLLLSDKQTSVYTDKIDEKGNWKVNYAEKDFKLSEGNHSVLEFCFDQKSGERSQLSDQQYFKVSSSWLNKLFNNIDVFLNITLIIILALGVFLIILTI